MSDQNIQNIVIIGGSSAGMNLATNLAPKLPKNYRVLLIDARTYTVWPVAAHRAAVVPGWEEHIVAPLTTDAVFAEGAKGIHQVVAGNKVVELRQSSVVLEQPFEGSTELPFFKAVLATGAQNPTPMRPIPGATQDQYQDHLRTLQRDLTKATKVLIIGGGPVGVETAGEVRERLPTASITIVHSKTHVMNPDAPKFDPKADGFNYTSPATPLKLSLALEAELKNFNIDLILEDRVMIPKESVDAPKIWDGTFGLQSGVKNVSLASGRVVEADFLFITVGNKPNAQLVEAVDPGAISKVGLVAVDSHLQIISKSPESILTENYFALGDVASAPGWKTGFGAILEARTLTTNILNIINKKPMVNYSRPMPVSLAVILGTKRGVAFMEIPIFGTVFFPNAMVRSLKCRELSLEHFYNAFKGPKKPACPKIK